MVDETPRFDARTFGVYTATEEGPISMDGARYGSMTYTRRDHSMVTIDNDDDAPVDHQRMQSPNATLFQPEDIYNNCNETGCTTVHSPKQVVTEHGRKQVGPVTSSEGGELVTVVYTVC